MSRGFDGIPAGSACTVTETANGAIAKVMATACPAIGGRWFVPAARWFP